MEKLVKTCKSALFLFLFVVFTKLFLDVLQQDSLERSAFSIFLKAFLLLVVIIVYITLFKLLQHFAPVWERYPSVFSGAAFRRSDVFCPSAYHCTEI